MIVIVCALLLVGVIFVVGYFFDGPDTGDSLFDFGGDGDSGGDGGGDGD